MWQLSNGSAEGLEGKLCELEALLAEGFEEKRNLTVEASGGAEIILNAELTPSAERME